MIYEAYEHTKKLVDCGVRIAGSKEVNRGIEYAFSHFKSLGLETIEYEIPIPVCSVKKSELSYFSDNREHELDNTAVLFSKPTPEGGLSLPLVYIGNGSVGEIGGQDIAGKAVLVSRDVYMDYPDVTLYKRLSEYKVAAVVFTAQGIEGHLPYVYSNYEYMDDPCIVPSVAIEWHTARKLVQLLQSRDITVNLSLELDVEMSSTVTPFAILHGNNSKKGGILFSGHMDSAYSSPGALDDGGAAASVLTLATHYKKLADEGILPDRNMYFACWCGHEPGLFGSKLFMQKYKDIADDIVLNINYEGIGSTMGEHMISYAGDESLGNILSEICDEKELEWPLVAGPGGFDTYNLSNRGTWTITMCTNQLQQTNHTPYDDIDLVSPYGFKHQLDYTLKLVDKILSMDVVPKGYPKWIEEESNNFGKRYGWYW